MGKQIQLSLSHFFSGHWNIMKPLEDRCDKAIPVIKSSAEEPAMLNIYPNPVNAGASINIDCEKLEEGYYTYQLFDLSGKRAEQKQLWIDEEAGIMNMEIPPVATGSYMLVLTNKETGKKFTEKIIIQ